MAVNSMNQPGKFYVSSHLPPQRQEEYRKSLHGIGLKEDTGNAASAGTWISVTGKPTEKVPVRLPWQPANEAPVLYQDQIRDGDEYIRVHVGNMDFETSPRGQRSVAEHIGRMFARICNYQANGAAQQAASK
jgi:hypothetical protein